MKKTTLSYLFTLFAAWTVSSAGTAVAQTPQSTTETFVLLNDGSLTVMSDSYITLRDTVNGQVRFHLGDGQGATYLKSFNRSEIASITPELPTSITLPSFATFKINNKYNGNVFTDAIGTISEDKNSVSLTVAAIDRTLIPSYSFGEGQEAAGARAYVDGKLQTDKISLVRFDNPVEFVIAYPKHQQILAKMVKPAVEGNTSEIVEKVTIKAEQLSTNYASSNTVDAIGNLVDGSLDTYFHTLWGQGLDQTIVTYFDIQLNAPLSQFQFGYTTRATSDNNMPSQITLFGSEDNSTWYEIETFTEKDGVPQSGYSQTFRSKTLTAQLPFKYLRFQTDRSTRRNYTCLAEFELFNVKPGSVDPTPAEYDWVTEPYGRKTLVTANFPASTSTRVPRIDIELLDGITLSDIHNAKKTYRRANIKIDGAGVWPDLSDSVQIRGRGNTSWSWQKKPYRLKFAKGQKPFGLTKGKSWVLLANHLSKEALLNNAIAMKAAQLVGTVATNHIVPVDLYVDGKYLGCYNFTENIGLSNNSVNLPNDATSVLFELDTYFDEDNKFRDDAFSLPVNFKDPDWEDYVADFGESAAYQYFEKAQDRFNAFTKTVMYGENFDDQIDVHSFASFLFVNDLIANLEIRHPKSSYLHNADVFDEQSPWIFGPVWDCDWAYGFESTRSFATISPEFDIFTTSGPNTSGRTFYKSVFEGSEKVRAAYYNLWYRFVNDGGIDALTTFIDDFYNFSKPSIQLNNETWYRGYDYWSGQSYNNGADYAEVSSRFKSWLTRRSNYILNHLEVFPLEDPTAITDARIDAELVREAAEAALNGQTSTTNVRKGIFTLSGTRVTMPRQSLPAGIYIIDGRKVIVR